MSRGEGRQPIARSLAWAVVAVVGAVIVFACLAQRSAGASALARAERAASSGETVLAIVAYGAAAEARCPLVCTAPSVALARLDGMATEAAQRGDDSTTIASLRAMRSAIASTELRTSTEREAIDTRLAEAEARRQARELMGGPGSARAPVSRPTPSAATHVLVGLGAIVFGAMALRFVHAKRFAPVELALAVVGAGLTVLGLVGF